MPAKTPRRASDVLGERTQFNADWTLEQAKEDFTLTGFERFDTAQGQAVVLCCERDGEPHRFVTWSRVIIQQLELLEEDFPIVARLDVAKGDKNYYYTLV